MPVNGKLGIINGRASGGIPGKRQTAAAVSITGLAKAAGRAPPTLSPVPGPVS